MQIALLLQALNGVFWSLAYVLIIWRSHTDKTYGMPLAALGANLSWEFMFGIVRPYDGVARIGVLVWLGLDLIILFYFLRYGHREFPGLTRAWFFSLAAANLLGSSILVYLVSVELPGGRGLCAYAQNLMMSALFIAMLLNRNDLRGQSLYIAVFKAAGSAAASCYGLLPGMRTEQLLYPALYVGIFSFDLLYVALLTRKAKQIGIRPDVSPNPRRDMLKDGYYR